MNNQLTKVQQQPIGELMSMAKAFAESGMFADTKSAAQAIVKIQAGQEIGIPPFAAMTGIHIIQGKPTIGAGLIAARIKGSGKYDYKVLEMSDAKCSIDFYQAKEMIGNSTFTTADAEKAKTQNMGKFPKNMLFARAISNGVKWYCPDVFAGPVYTPEELQTIDVDHEEVNNNPPDLFEKTSLHNHKELGNVEKPLIKNKALKDACERLEQGNLTTSDGSEQLYDKLIDTYTFESSQRSALDAAWQKGCIVADKKADLPFNA